MNWTKTKRPKSIKDMYLTDTNRTKLEAIEKGLKGTTCILLCGPSGMGKTTAARIFAKKLSSSDEMIREINAADTNGVEDARKLAEWSQSPSIHGKKKVIILDEAQMLTKNAQNCLLKPSEDSDMSCMIFCTTNPEKIIPAIKGRATKSTVYFDAYSYHLHGDLVIDYLRGLSKNKLGEEYLKLIAEKHENIRAFVQILEQLMSTKLVDTAQAKEIIGNFQDDGHKEQAIQIIRKIAGALYNQYDYQKKLDLWSEIGPQIRDLTDDISSFRHAMTSYLSKVLTDEQIYRAESWNFSFLVGLQYELTEGVEISKDRLIVILLRLLFNEEA